MSYRQNASEITTNYTQTLSQFITGLKYEDIPPDVIERAKIIAVHTIGAALAAKGMPIADKAIRLGKLTGNGDPRATVWVDGGEASMISAALANSILADIMNWEDCSWTGRPSAGVIPTALAVAEAKKKSGKELLTSIVLGYECYQRIAMAVQPPKDWDITNGWGIICWQIFAALVPAARLLELNNDQLNQAFGFGATACPIPSNLHQVTMSDESHYEYGLRAKDGILSVLSAAAGVDNYMDCFDDPWSYELHMTSSSRPEWYTRDLGESWLIMRTLLKRWPANIYMQNAMEITRDLLEHNGITAETVEEITVNPPVAQCMEVCPEGYQSLTQAQFSLPFMLASLILDPVPGKQWFDEEKLKDSRILALAARVRAGCDEPVSISQIFRDFQNGEFPETTITIRTTDGGEFSKSMRYYPGHAQNMFSRQDIENNFRLQTRNALAAEKANEILNAFWNLEQYDDVSVIAQLLKN
ncbi:MAG: MmgE/PrpD family protein [Clostridia bacterium]|nr:MmgE/PrpD family protein [Clostridia bacterium]